MKKAGFSGTLDPFASGVLIVAFGAYTRLFQYLAQEPKVYEACIWLGASSPSGDNENIESVGLVSPFEPEILEQNVSKLQGILDYTPPKYSAKHVDGVRAYELARRGVDFELKAQQMRVFSASIIHYTHPFLLVRLVLSKGAYARSWAELLAKNLGINATLSALERKSEGEFFYENEKALNPLKHLKIAQNWYLKDQSDIELGKKLCADNFKIKENGEYFVKFEKFFSIIEILEGQVKYKLNGVENVDFI